MSEPIKPLSDRLRKLEPVVELHCANAKIAQSKQMKEITEALEKNGVKAVICPTEPKTANPGGVFIDVRNDPEVQRQADSEKKAIAGKATASPYSRPAVDYNILVKSHGYDEARGDLLQQMSIWVGQVIQPKLTEMQMQNDLPMRQIRVFEKPASMTDSLAPAPKKPEKTR